MLVGGLFVVLTNIFALLGPWILKDAIDSLKRHISSEVLVKYAALLIGVALVEGIFRFLMRNIIIGVSRRVEYDLRNDYLAHLQKLSQAFYNKFKTGDLMARATNDLEAVRQVAGPAFMYSLNTLFSLTAFFIMLFIDVRLALLAMIPFPFMALLVNRMAKKLHYSYDSIQAQYASITARAQENLSGIRVVKAYVQEEPEIESFKRLNRIYINKNLQLAKIRGVLSASMVFLVGAGTVILLWFGGRLVMQNRITLGDLVAFFSYLGMLTWPMMALGWVINLVQQGIASMGRINRVLETEPDIRDEPHTDRRIRQIKGEIEFRDVSFSYNGEPVLKDINLKIRNGMTLAIVGPTGSGKSTLVNLIPRILDASGGRILIDGEDVRNIPVKVLRRNIGYVPQDTFLFSDTIKENIALGVEAPSLPEVEEAAVVSQIKKDVLDFPRQFDTMLGERGINLSGGQKQRTAIARAVIRKPRILILDDALSAVDTYTEEEILKRLREIMRQRTSVIVSHRVSTVKDADMIIVLEDGAIREQGTHDELIAFGGLYAELHRKQLLEEALEQL